MAKTFDYLLDVNPRKLAWSFNIYVVRIWEGDRIHASIPKCVVARWRGNIFEFQMSISDLLNAEILDDTYLFDMIAEVVGKEDPRNLVTSTGKKTKRMAVVLEDLYVEPFIVVLLLFKASWWNGKITVQSHFYISKIHIERDLKEVVSFKNRLLSGAPLNSIRISHLSSQETWSVADELKQGSVGVKTIEETLNDAECPKKIKTSTIERYESKGYGHTAGTASIRYKVEVIVYDGTDSMTLFLWDREAIPLFEKRADQIKEEEINIKSANIDQYDQVYTISKVCDDEDIIEKNFPKESNTNSSINLTEIGCNDFLEITENVADIKTDSDNLCVLLSTTLFVKQNFKKNKDRNQSLIIGVGYPPSASNSQWFVMADVEHGHQLQLNIPANINQLGFYSMVGFDNGNLCIKYCQGGLNSNLMILNPLTQYMNYISDEAKRHCCHAVNLYALRYLVDSIEYRIVHVYKKYFFERHISWMLYNSFEADWKYSGTFISDVLKVGPKSIVDKEVIYWIGWEGVGYAEPTSILFFSLQQMIFNEAKISEQVKLTYHCVTHFKNGIWFVSYGDIDFTRTLFVWQLSCVGDDVLFWDKMLKISGIVIPFNLTLYVGNDILLVLESRNSHGGANDAEITDILVSKLKYMTLRRKNLLVRTWHEDLSVKTVTLHSKGLYMV
ncbi:hypothetical protein AHAS_Ahas04G0178200 [Arachis hypogaea]